MTKGLVAVLLFIFPTMFTGSASKLPDTLVCVEMSISRGECVRSVSGTKLTIDETRPYNGKTWWQMRPTNLVIPMQSWIEMKKFIIKMCKQNEGTCDSQVSDCDRSLETIDQFSEQKLP